MSIAKFDRNMEAAKIALEERILSLKDDLGPIDPEPAEDDIMTTILNERIWDLSSILDLISDGWNRNQLIEPIKNRIKFIKETYPDDKWNHCRIADLNHVKGILIGQDA